MIALQLFLARGQKMNIRDEYVIAMGEDMGHFCYELQADFDWLRHKWSEFRHLFANERIDLLNVVASNFFLFLHTVLFEDAMLHLCRLTDPPESRNRAGVQKNLTVITLTDMLSDPVLKASVENKIAEVRGNCEFARKWRNKHLAHTDLETALKGRSLTLPSADITNIDTAVISIKNLLGTIDAHYRLPVSAFADDPWGAKSLVHHLEQVAPPR